MQIVECTHKHKGMGREGGRERERETHTQKDTAHLVGMDQYRELVAFCLGLVAASTTR